MAIKHFPKKGQYIRTSKIRILASQKAMGNTHCKGRIITPELKEKLRISNLGKKHKFSPRPSRRGKLTWNAGTRKIFSFICPICDKSFQVPNQENRKFCSTKCFQVFNRGENNYRWIKDRTKLIKREKRDDSAYKEWRRCVFIRDKFKCKIAMGCFGKITAHHILRWKDYPQFRYKLTNGIILCYFHHPRTRKAENASIPLFQKLIDSHKL